MSQPNYLTAFNNHFNEFVDDVEKVFPEDHTFRITKRAVFALSKINPLLTIQTWNSFITEKYYDDVMKGDPDFVIERDYTEDLMKSANPKKMDVLRNIEKIRGKVRLMKHENKEKAMKYIQNLTKLSKLYFLTKEY